MTPKEKAEAAKAAKAALKNKKAATKGLTAVEIKEQFTEQLATGEVVLVHARERENGKWDYQFAQKGNGIGSQDLAIIMRVRGLNIGSGVRSAYLNGITAEQHAINEANNLIVGATIPDAKLVVIETTVPPAYVGELNGIEGVYMRSAKRIPQTGVDKKDYPYAVTPEGKFIWSTVELRPLESEDVVVPMDKTNPVDPATYDAAREEWSASLYAQIESTTPEEQKKELAELIKVNDAILFEEVAA